MNQGSLFFIFIKFSQPLNKQISWFFQGGKMKQKQTLTQEQEMEILSEQVNPEEFYILGFLKGFDRETLKKWNKKGLMDFSVKYL
jgi:hypothetical protein